jgi:hypothetical protein
MSTFTFGFVISQLALLNRTLPANADIKDLCIKVYARPELLSDLEQTVVITKTPIHILDKLSFSSENLRQNREIVVVDTIIPRR